MEKVKIVITTPLTHSNIVRETIGKWGGGKIGNYSYCSFSTIGVGRFKPNNGAKPYIGQKNKLEEVKEEKIEFICLKNKAKRIIEEIKRVHPYEELGLDIFPLINEEDL